ncbi:MAG: hypothetical protein ABI702_10205 [Burkholderiales bacterium]
MPASTQRLMPTLALLMAGLGAGGAWAVDDGDDAPRPAATDELRFTRSDVPAVAVSGLPDRRTGLTAIGVERWVSRGRAGFGVGLGSIALVDRPFGGLTANADAATLTRASGSLLMLGLRYRASDQSSLYAHAINVRGLGAESDERVVGKVGIEFKAAQSQWGVDYGGLGLRLAGDARMTLKLRRGGLGIFMRRSF